MKKLAVCLIAAICLFTLTACGGKDYKVTYFGTYYGEDEGMNKEFTELLDGYEKTEYFKIERIKADEENGIAGDDAAALFEKALAGNASIIFAYGDVHDAAEKYASENPNVSFVGINCGFSGKYQNLAGVVFGDDESAFLAGYVAARMSESGEVGFLGGIEDEACAKYESGFKAGVRYANSLKGLSVSVQTYYVGSYNDAEGGREGAEELYSRGCDIVFQAAGESGKGAMEVASEQEKYIMGSEYDQSELAQGRVIMSTLKRPARAVSDIMEAFIRGRVIGGKNYTYGLKEGGVEVTDNSANLIPEEIYSDMLSLKSNIINGSVAVSAYAE